MIIAALIATVPRRRDAVQRLLEQLTKQTLVPDRVELVLDGYGQAEAPECGIPARLWRTARPSGPGNRWRVLKELPADATVVVVDDDLDLEQAPDAVRTLAEAVVPGQTAAAGRGAAQSGRLLNYSKSWPGPLVLLQTGLCAFVAGDLAELQAMRQAVIAKHRFDPLGDLGDDEAMVSACLIQRGVMLRKVAIEGVRFAPGTQDALCQNLRRRRAHGLVEREARAYRDLGWARPKVWI